MNLRYVVPGGVPQGLFRLPCQLTANVGSALGCGESFVAEAVTIESPGLPLHFKLEDCFISSLQAMAIQTRK
jgi:hypothetical protein